MKYFSFIILTANLFLSSAYANGNSFSLKLFDEIRKTPGNIFISALSIRTVLGMAYLGAKGKTAEEMSKALEADSSFHSSMKELIHSLNHPVGFQLSLANALWGQKGHGFLKGFLALSNETYGAGLRELDFSNSEETRKTINDWVAKQTKDKILNLIQSGALDSSTKLVLTNAIYFKAKWKNQFKKQDTEDAPFYLDATRSVTTRLMKKTESVRYGETEGEQVIELPYEGGSSLVVILPKKSKSLNEIEKKFHSEAFLKKTLNSISTQEVNIFLPKFKSEFSFSPVQALQSLGMKAAFDPNKADFSGMTGKKDLFISAIIHKAYCALDEEGTEAAAATAMMVTLGSARIEKPPVLFRADHPFLYLIQEKGQILFIGRMANPA